MMLADLRRMVGSRRARRLWWAGVVVYSLLLTFGTQAVLLALGVSGDWVVAGVAAAAMVGTVVFGLVARAVGLRLSPSRRYSLERAAEEDARELLEAAERDRGVAELVAEEARRIGAMISAREPLTRAALTSYLNGLLDAVTQPGWSLPYTSGGISPVRLHIAGICHLARSRNLMR